MVATARNVDLNADLGEGAGSDAELLAVVTSASVACGAHAGDARTMRDTVARAAELGIAIGAHPGYPDRANFGRREMGASATEIENWIREQVESMRDVCREAGVPLRYVKAHGALYNRAVHDADAAAAIATAVRGVDDRLALLALPGSRMLLEARRIGLATAREAFLDRAYESDGSLVPRDVAGAVLKDEATAAERAIAIARGEPIRDIHGRDLRVEADSLCVHGDTPASLALARAVRTGLESAGIRLAAFA